MTVHGEREKLPAVTKAEGTKALQHFADGYNETYRTLDPERNSAYEAGALLAIDQAIVKKAHGLRPQGNPGYRPVTFKDVNITVPKQAGWPKSFVADAVTNQQDGAGHYTRWYLVFSRDSIQAKWRAVYLATFKNNAAPELKTSGGYAEAVPLDGSSGLTVAPGKLSKAYADYLNTGKGSTFASGESTDGLRKKRAGEGNQPGQRILVEDQAANFPPVALRTADGGALVFFANYYHQQKTTSQGYKILVPAKLRGIVEGSTQNVHQMTFTWISTQAVQVPGKSAGGTVDVLNRIEETTAAKTS